MGKQLGSLIRVRSSIVHSGGMTKRFRHSYGKEHITDVCSHKSGTTLLQLHSQNNHFRKLQGLMHLKVILFGAAVLCAPIAGLVLPRPFSGTSAIQLQWTKGCHANEIYKPPWLAEMLSQRPTPASIWTDMRRLRRRQSERQRPIRKCTAASSSIDMKRQWRRGNERQMPRLRMVACSWIAMRKARRSEIVSIVCVQWSLAASYLQSVSCRCWTTPQYYNWLINVYHPKVRSRCLVACLPRHTASLLIQMGQLVEPRDSLTFSSSASSWQHNSNRPLLTSR